MLIRSFFTLGRTIDGGDRSTLWRWLATLVMTGMGTGVMLYGLLLALERQRSGEPFVRETFLFFVAVAFWHRSSTRVWSHAHTALNEAARSFTLRIVKHLRQVPLERFESIGRAEIATRLTSDTQRVANAALPFVLVPIALIRLLWGAAFVLLVAPQAAEIAILAMVFVGFVISEQSRNIGASVEQMAADEVQLDTLLRAQIAGAIPIKLHARRADAIDRAFTCLSERITATRVSLFTHFFARQHLANAFLFGILGVNVFLLPLVLDVGNEATRETCLVLVWMGFSLFDVLTNLPEVINAAQAMGRLEDFDARLVEEPLEPVIDNDTLARPRFTDFQSLEARGLAFHYSSRNGSPGFTVGPLDATFQRGEVVFITGHNGSGKSTFLKMLTGLYRVSYGELCIDGISIGESDLVWYRELFATIFADYHLFARVHGLGEPDAPRVKELLEAMQIAHKTDVVAGRLTNRDLSTGQKKRLALVLARLQDRPIMLFDEWAADQDPDFRHLFYHELLPALRADGKLVIAVTHDDQYFHCADRLLCFVDGLLVPHQDGS